jgi:hypothetical protein
MEYPPTRDLIPLQLAKSSPRFLRGPIPLPWLQRASRLPGKAMTVAVILWWKVGCTKRWEVRFCQRMYQEWGVSIYAARRAIRALASEGLVTVMKSPGRGLMVTLNEPSLERSARQ